MNSCMYLYYGIGTAYYDRCSIQSFFVVRFWQACQHFKQLPASSLHSEAEKIYEEYVSPKANEAVNINQQILAGVQKAMKKPTRYLFEDAEVRRDETVCSLGQTISTPLLSESHLSSHGNGQLQEISQVSGTKAVT